MDHGIQTDQAVGPHYDPMLAKVIAYGENRSEAIRRLASAVQDTQLLGLNNNKLFLQNVLRHPVFGAGEATTAFIEQHFSADVSMSQKHPSEVSLAKAALVLFLSSQANSGASGWQRSAVPAYRYQLAFEGEAKTVTLQQLGERKFTLEVGESSFTLEAVALEEQSLVLIDGGVRQKLHFARDNTSLYLDDGNGHFVLDDVTQQPTSAGGGAGGGQVKANMDGAIVEVLVQAGDTVNVGQTLVVLESMKMEHPLKAAIDGVVESISCEAGQQVKTKQLLITVAGEGDA